MCVCSNVSFKNQRISILPNELKKISRNGKMAEKIEKNYEAEIILR